MSNIEDQISKKIKRSDGTVVEMTYSDIVLDRTKGKEHLNASYPDEFEYYACAFELVNEDGDTLDFFSFPMMPQSISESKQSSSNVKKTLGGVVVTNHSTFMPFDISISGNFGRKFRKVAHKHISKGDAKNNDTGVSGKVGDETQIKEVVIQAKKVFSSEYKTGYACIKIIEGIFNRAYRDTDDNRRPLRLFFYNLSLNSNHLVEPVNLQISQNRDQNMIWQYNMQLKAVAPASYVNSKYKDSLSAMRDYNRKYVRMTHQSSIINEMLKDVINGMTPVQSILNQSGNYKAHAEQSGLKLLKQLTDNPIDNFNFIKSRR